VEQQTNYILYSYPATIKIAESSYFLSEL